MIAGKTQLSTLNALLSGLTNTLEDGSNEFQSLYGCLEDSDGALSQMAETMTDNLAGALSLAQSAFQDLQIEVGSKLEPYITQAIRWFSEELPEAAEELGTWLDNKILRAIDFCEESFETIKPYAEFITDNFEEIAISAGTVAAGLKAFSIASKTAKFFDQLKGTLKGLTTAQKLATVAQTAFNTSLIACPIAWVTVGLAAATAGVLVWRKHLEKADIANHFGNISLSMEECTEIARNFFGNDIMTEIDNVSSAYSEVQSSIESLSDSARALNKLNFKFEYGGNVSAEEYLSEAESYISDFKSLLDEQQYSINLSADLLFGDGEIGNYIKTAVDNLYNGEGGLGSQFETESQLLTDILQNAIDNGLEINAENVRAQFAKLEEIRNQMAIDESAAKMQALQYDFTMGDLSEDSFKNMMEAMQTEAENIEEAYKSALIQGLSGLNSAYYSELNVPGLENYISEDDFKTATQAAYDKYYKNIADAKQKELNFGSQAIMEAYSDEFEIITNAFNELTDAGTSAKGIAESLNWFADSTFGHGGKTNISSYFEYLNPALEEMQGYLVKAGEDAGNAYSDTLISTILIGAAGGNGDMSLGAAAEKIESARKLPDELQSVYKKYKEAAKTIPDETSALLENAKNLMLSSLPDSIINNQSPPIEAIGTVKTNLIEEFQLPIDVEIPVNASFDVDTEEFKNQYSGLDSFRNIFEFGSVDSNATGTTYFGGGWTRINENGGEIVNLPTGTSIIPADKSRKVGSGVSLYAPITIHVNGNILGIDDAIEVIGNGVCERICDLVAGM